MCEMMKKKICFVKWVVNEAGGGLKVAVNLANELQEKYEVHLVSVFSTEDVFFELNNNVHYQSLSKEKLSMSRDFLKAVKLLRSYIVENDISILFGIGITMNAVGVVGTLGLKTKFVSCDHTNSISDNRTLVQKIQRYIGAFSSSKIIALTEKDRLNYIYNWINSIDEEKKYNLDSKKLITVGRFHQQKGYDYLSKVAIKVLSRYPDWQWDIYGSGNDQIKQYLITELDKGGVLSRVHFKGNVKGTDNIYPDHAIYVMTSRYEGLPLVLLEAKQYGLPIVSFNCPTGPAEIVLDKENGYLVDDYDINYMSEKIFTLIENENLRAQFAEKSMKDTEKFSKKKIIKQWEDLIEGMIGR